MSDFDPIKAQGEVIAGLADVHRVILARARAAERDLGEAEENYNATVKMEAFMASLLTEARAKLKALNDEAEAKLKD